MPKLFTSSKVIAPTPISLRNFHSKRREVLIMRETGGVGDILMHRMMFEDFKAIDPEMKLVFATLPCYFPILEDHPFIDQLVDCRKVNPLDYIISYNTTSACSRYENCIAPRSGLHRSDIWANHCGVTLTHHNMHLSIPAELTARGARMIQSQCRDPNKPKVAFCPISAMVVKDLLFDQMAGVVQALRESNCFVFSLHTVPVPELHKLNVPVFYSIDFPTWMGLISAADYVISVDTSHFHLAGGIGKPVTGIFTFADGKVYGKYYDFELVQKHRDNGNWDCGPCYNWGSCPKALGTPKPCLTEITVDEIMDAVRRMFDRRPWEVNKNTASVALLKQGAS